MLRPGDIPLVMPSFAPNQHQGAVFWSDYRQTWSWRRSSERRKEDTIKRRAQTRPCCTKDTAPTLYMSDYQKMYTQKKTMNVVWGANLGKVWIKGAIWLTPLKGKMKKRKEKDEQQTGRGFTPLEPSTNRSLPHDNKPSSRACITCRMYSHLRFNLLACAQTFHDKIFCTFPSSTQFAPNRNAFSAHDTHHHNSWRLLHQCWSIYAINKHVDHALAWLRFPSHFLRDPQTAATVKVICLNTTQASKQASDNNKNNNNNVSDEVLLLYIMQEK